ncbi:hypothetical protein ROLI_048430 (plasmid) [Roseobacter fucihabitans]|uniref:site-specific DNA-methyltransferase (adenine-specific) n=1 Tax=Roseobacter fucihabitans TaxID=1537242 RepID=A0ABZ2C0T9_9RHOB|nr:N-6 DNA methylase [Roseobacter litoralis]MBC6967845.1 Modification methylase VspI [Roseobacter litoralis]
MLITKLERRFEDAAVSLPVGFEKGQVFTPRFLATWGAVLLKEHLGETWSGNLLDPACGDGELLDAALEQLPNAKLFGMDIDCEASQAAQTRLGTSAIIKTEDMLLSPALNQRQQSFKVGALISNPPWGADLLHSSGHLRALGYTLANGQFDSWSLFVEMSLKALDDDGMAVFILPDAIFSPEHASTRLLLAENYTVELIARLGEGIFKGVYRGTTVLLVRKRKPASNHVVEAFRLSKTQRAAVLSGDLDLEDARQLASHRINQSRFLSDAGCRWDIDVRRSEQNLLGRLEASGGSWTELVASGRGVELSKRGLVKVCETCNQVTPSPTRPRDVTCQGCGRTAHSEEMTTQRIVEVDTEKQSGFMPLIVGEDIGRYALSCSRRIKLDVPGINYKSREIYSQERLLVRKTGIGLKATVTKKVAASNQVVFHYVPLSEDLNFFLYYVLGVLSSRVMFAYHLRKSGENEWRSHPYVTPKTLKELPIPSPKRGTQSWRQAVEIASRVKKHVRNGGKSKKLDLEIEGLVAGLYNLDHSDLDWVKQVICEAQNLEPMRVLSDFDSQSIHIEMVP